MRPAGLHHADARLGEVVDHLHQPVRRGHKVGVEDGDQLAARDFEALVQRARLVAVPIRAMQMHDGLRRQSRSAARVTLDDLSGHLHRLVGGVVEQLNLEAVARIVQPADRVDQPVDDELLVEDGKLHGDKRQFARGKVPARLVPQRLFLLVVVVEPHQLVAMDAVKRQDHHDDEVGNQDRQIEGVPAVEPMEGAVAVVRVQIVAKPLRGQKEGRRRVQIVEKGEQKETPRRCLRSRRFYAKRLIRETIFVQAQKIRRGDDIHPRDSRAVKMSKVALVAGD